MRTTRSLLALVALALAVGACAPAASVSRSETSRDLLEQELSRSVMLSL